MRESCRFATVMVALLASIASTASAGRVEKDLLRATYEHFRAHGGHCNPNPPSKPAGVRRFQLPFRLYIDEQFNCLKKMSGYPDGFAGGYLPAGTPIQAWVERVDTAVETGVVFAPYSLELCNNLLRQERIRYVWKKKLKRFEVLTISPPMPICQPEAPCASPEYQPLCLPEVPPAPPAREYYYPDFPRGVAAPNFQFEEGRVERYFRDLVSGSLILLPVPEMSQSQSQSQNCSPVPPPGETTWPPPPPGWQVPQPAPGGGGVNSIGSPSLTGPGAAPVTSPGPAPVYGPVPVPPGGPPAPAPSGAF